MGGTYEPLSDATVTDVWGIMWMRYIAAMGLTILIYDYVLTIADEVRLIFLCLYHFSRFSLPLAPRFALFGQGLLPCQNGCISLIAI